jgi:site-specific recombinase XerD
VTLQLVQEEYSAKSPQPPRRKSNREVRSREYLTGDEVKRLREAARQTGRNGFRDALLISMMFRHGLRVSEVVALTRDAIHFENGTIYIQRSKNGTPATHYLDGDETRQLKRLFRESAASRFVFCSERGGPLSERSAHHIVQRAGEVAELPFTVHPHMLRHAKGYQLAQRGVDTRTIQGFLGHRDIKSTVVYTELDPSRYAGLERD